MVRRAYAPSIVAALVAVAFAPAVAAQASGAPPQVAVPQQIACRGDEPSWSLDANRTTGQLNRVGSKAKQVVEFRGEAQALTYLQPPILVWRGASTHLPNETLVATLREESCRSTMADAAPLAWRVVLSVRAGETLTGCCSVKSGYDTTRSPLAVFASKPESDWSRRWPDLAAGVQRCVSESGFTVREVAKAWSPSKGAVAARLSTQDGKAWTCAVDAASRAKPVLVAVAADAPPLAGANAPVYYPPRDPPPIVACGRLERIASGGPRSRTEGWLHYDRC
jgi:uncharacterized membrane protein